MSRRANRPAPKRDVAARPGDSAATSVISSRPSSADEPVAERLRGWRSLGLAGKGQPGINGGKPGDLYLRVHIQANGVFRQKGFDIQVTLPVWPWEAALGAEVMAPTLTEPVKVKIPPGSKADSKLRLKGKGLPTSTGEQGDLFLKLKIVMPTAISDEERALYEQLGRARHSDPRAEIIAASRRSSS